MREGIPSDIVQGVHRPRADFPIKLPGGVNQSRHVSDGRDEWGDPVPMTREGVDPDRTARRLHATAAGSHPAFEALYKETAPAVYRYLIGAGVKEPTAADVLQETYLVVWRDAGRYRGEGAALAWIFGIARNKLRDYRRADREVPVEAPVADGSPMEEGGYERVRTEEMLSRLTPADRELLHLLFVADMGYADVARILGVPVGTVKSRVFRLRKTLRAREGFHVG